MKKTFSIIFALIVMMVCAAFAFNAYADEISDIEQDVTEAEEVTLPIEITSNNTVISLSTQSYTYNGEEKKPSTVVVYTDEEGKETVLKKNVDYTVSYSNNKKAGTATVNITGKSEYTGTISENFTIKSKKITGNAFTSSISYTNIVYSGKEAKPSVTVSWNNNGKKIKLVKNTDYTVTYSNNKKVGKATVKITGIKNYSGSVKKTFNILPQKVTGIEVKNRKDTSLTLAWQKLTNISGYQIFKYDSKQKKYVCIKTVAADKTSYNVTGLSASTSYKFKIRAYKKLSDGKTNLYGDYSSVKATATTPGAVTCTSVTKSGTTIKVQWKTTKGSGYQIIYSKDSSFKKNCKTIMVSNSSKSSYNIKNVSKTATYYVKVKAYYNANNRTYSGAYSSMLSTYYSNLYATYTSYYDAYNKNRTTNLILASKEISGTIIQPGETFDFNNVVGPRTVAKGYKEASVFAGSGSGIGGGICQVASTMFNCALISNMDIVERHQHSKRVGYVPNGRDAAIYGTAENFRWKNTSKYPVRIVMTVKDGKITCSFYTSVNAAPPKVSLSVTQNGNLFTLKRSVGGKVNYTTKSRY